jgi:hypothetical protein
MSRFARRLLIALICLFVLAWAYRIYLRKMYIWIPGFVLNRMYNETAAGPKHIFFFYTDHFEPGANKASMDRWVAEYPKIADRHHDSVGRPAQHSWFYPGEQPIDYNLESLRKLVDGGYGEVELHYHHANDTPESGRKKFADAVVWFQKFGYLKGTDGKTHFGFIHGNWGLDNSRGNEYCGNYRELQTLLDLGCYADFTFPSIWWESQPSIVNSIFESVDDDRPKSYDKGTLVRAGRSSIGGLTIFEGPLLLALTPSPSKLFALVEDGNIHLVDPVNERRVDLWVKANVHVQGRPDWVFIKVHGHGASTPEDMQETLGGGLERGLSYLERHYNDGSKFVLHYVTAREAYNVARAAADGKTGDPQQYMNYVIPAYAGPRK